MNELKTGHLRAAADRCRAWFTANFSGTEGALCHLSALVFAVVEGVDLASTCWPGALGSVVLSAGLLAATELGLWLARKLLCRLLGHGLGWLMGLGLLLFAVSTTVAGGAGEGWTWRVYLFSGLVAGALWLMTAAWRSIFRRRISPTTVSAALLSTGLTALLAVFLFTDGFDDHIIHKLAALNPERDARRESLEPSLGPGPWTVETLDYGPGEALPGGTMNMTAYMDRDTDDLTGKYVDAYMDYDLSAVPLRGRVWYPAGGEHRPVLFIAHGNHEITTPSYLGYAYLGEYLASHGYVVVSVDHNACNMLSGENDGRAVLLLEHIGLLLDYSGDKANPLYNALDAENIAIAGHSRGGEMAATAYLFNGYDRYPENGAITFDYNYAIKSVIAIAPTVNQYRPAGHSVELEDVNYLLLHGASDRDVDDFMGMAQYGNVTFTGAGDYLKSALYIAGANHGQFNTLWGEYDQTGPFTPLFNTEGLLPAGEQQEIAKIFIKVFLDVTLLGDNSNRELLTDWRHFAGQLPETAYVQASQSSGFVPLADFEEDADLETGSCAGVTLRGSGFNWWTEERLGLAGSSVYDAHALRLRWRGSADYRLETPGVDLTGRALSFDLGDRDSAAVERGELELLDAVVEITDAGGRKAQARLRDHAVVFPILPVRTDKLDFLFGTPTYKYALATVTIPAEDFRPVEEAVDLGNIVSINIHFAGSGQVSMDNFGICKQK